MLKDIKDARQISCYNTLTGRYLSINDGWKDLDDDTCNEVFDLCKEFIAKTAGEIEEREFLMYGNHKLNHAES